MSRLLISFFLEYVRVSTSSVEFDYGAFIYERKYVHSVTTIRD